MKIEFKNEIIEYTIEYKKRKTVELKIDPTGVVRIKAPKGTDESVVLKILIKKGDWILKKIDEMFTKSKRIEKRSYEDGEEILFLGKLLKLTIYRRDLTKTNISIVNNELIISVPNKFEIEEISALIEKYYRKELKKIIDKRIGFYQNNFKIKPKNITIKSQKTRWGSCSSERNINFNWKLIMAPIEIIDYLIVHEMSHLVHMNHSKSFWSLVGKIMPDYKKRQNWLNENGFLLTLDFKVVGD